MQYVSSKKKIQMKQLHIKNPVIIILFQDTP